MISKYFLWTSALILNLLLLSSCLKSSDNNIEYPTDPQIYTIALSSKADTTSLLPGVVFTINQVKKEGEIFNGEIFNKEPLPFGFHVDSVMLSLTGLGSYAFAKVEVTLSPDSTYTWNKTDSIAINRLRKIKTTAPDGVTTKKYDFTLHTYQEDPYILRWEKKGDSYLPSPVESQKTVSFKNKIYTFYESGQVIKAVSSVLSDTPAWQTVPLQGMPASVDLTTMVASETVLYALDKTSGTVYNSLDGSVWSTAQTGYKVKALYGKLPFSLTADILVAVQDGEKTRFARANNDFSTVVVMNEIPTGVPVKDFSAITMESSTSYASKFIFLSGGNSASNADNNEIWLLQEDNGTIKYIVSKKPTQADLKGSTLFFYDDRPYLIATSAGKNVLVYSENYGVEWVVADENHSLPVTGFTDRKYASVITDSNNNIWIFGGISLSGNTQLVDIWKGQFNKFIQN